MSAIDIMAVDVGEVERLITHRDKLIELEKDLDLMIDWNNTDPEHLQRALKYRSLKIPRRETFDCSMLVMVWGAFERFLKNSFMECADLVTVPNDNRENRSRLQNQNIVYSGKAIAGYVLKPDRFDIPPLPITEALHDFLKDPEKAKLNSAALSVIDFSLNPDSILTYYSRINLEITWEKIGNSPKLKKFLKDRSKKNTGKEARSLLKWVYAKRNSIAHSGGSEITLQPHSIDQLIEFIKLVATAINTIARRNIDTGANN